MRQPYFGFGTDAHSMLLPDDGLAASGFQAVRFSTPETLETFLSDDADKRLETNDSISDTVALEEEFFLGLRLNCGIDTGRIERQYGNERASAALAAAAELFNEGLLRQESGRLLLTDRGRLLANEVFERFVDLETTAAAS